MTAYEICAMYAPTNALTECVFEQIIFVKYRTIHRRVL